MQFPQEQGVGPGKIGRSAFNCAIGWEYSCFRATAAPSRIANQLRSATPPPCIAIVGKYCTDGRKWAGVVVGGRVYLARFENTGPSWDSGAGRVGVVVVGAARDLHKT